MSENSIKFSLSNSEQRDSWLNSSHWTLDTDTLSCLLYLVMPEVRYLLYLCTVLPFTNVFSLYI